MNAIALYCTVYYLMFPIGKADGANFLAGRFPHLPHDHLNIRGRAWLHVGTFCQLRLRVHDLSHHVRRFLGRLFGAYNAALHFISKKRRLYQQGI